MEPTTTGYVDTEGLHLYYETYGATGTPVLLLHGGVLSIDQAWTDLVPVLAADHVVIATDAQGHGRSSDTDRDIKPETMARDVVAVLDHLGIDKVHLVGHSMGGAVGLQVAIDHSDRLLSLTPMSASVRPEGQHSDFASPEAMAASTRMPTMDDFVLMRSTYERLSPTPDAFDTFMEKMQNGEEFYRGWSDEELARIAVPVLIVQGDHDFTTIEHAGVMLELIPGSTLAVLPGTTHMQVTARVDPLTPLLADFLG